MDPSKVLLGILLGILITGFIILLLITVSSVIKCFYDEAVYFGKKRVAIFGGVTFTVIIGCLFPAIFSDDIGLYGLLIPGAILMVFFIGPIVMSFGRNKRIKYYIENVLLYTVVTHYLLLYFLCIASLIYLVLTKLRVTALINLFLNKTGAADMSGTAGLSMLIIATLILPLMLISVYLWTYLSFIEKDIVLPMRKNETALFIGLHFLNLFICFMSIADGSTTQNPAVYISVKLLMTTLLIILPVLVVKGRQTAYYNELSTRNEQFLEAELVAADTYRKAQEDTRAFRHDMNNNLSAVVSLMSEKKYSAAEEYIRSMSANLSSFSPGVVTGDDMLDSLISSKLPVMKENNIDFSSKGIIEGGLKWKPIDICAVFANLLDNAIEACNRVSSEKRYIRIIIMKTEYQQIISIKNSTESKVDCSVFESEGRYSTKSDGSSHGYGMKNVKKALSKNGAMMEIDCNDTEFVVNIVIMRFDNGGIK